MEKNFFKKLRKKLPFNKKEETLNKQQKVETSKNNIEILDKDPESFFLAEDNPLPAEQKTAPAPKKAPEQAKKKNRAKSSLASSSKSESSVNTTKNNIPLLDESEDLIKSFKQKKETPYHPKKIIVRPEKKIKKEPVKNKSKLKNKNGIRVLDDFSDIYESFLDSGESIKSSDSFKNESALLRQKKDAPSPKPLSLEKRIQRYPAPEISLDLHGFTSVQAKLKSENFILSSFEKGFFTLRIITGKGIHSDAGAVLPEITEDVVKDLMGRKKVLSYSWENRKDGKSGSMIVYLNRFD